MDINSGVFAVIFNEKKEILLIRRNDYDVWEIPGGGWEQGETPWDAVVREVKEETGLDVEVERLVRIGSRPKKNDLIFTFLCKVVGGEMVTTDEAREIGYFSMDNFPENVVPAKINRIQDALKFEDKCILKNIDDAQTTKEFLQEKGLL